MSTLAIAHKLTKPQRDLLLEHVDGLVPVKQGLENFVRNALFERRLLRFERTLRPQNTILTDLGREVLCALLGSYADALVRASILPTTPLIEIKRAPRLADDHARSFEDAQVAALSEP